LVIVVGCYRRGRLSRRIHRIGEWRRREKGGELSGQRLALPANIGHRCDFPECRARHRPDGKEPLPDLAVAIAQRAARADVEAQPVAVRADIAAVEQRADQRITTLCVQQNSSG
jgi:hypothetical protein